MHEKANLAVVLQAYHDGEGDSLDPQGFMDLFAASRAYMLVPVVATDPP